ncbi:MAG: CcmD family protein [Acidobacteria bacterium]|nr:CcmD family protein [Acidobacteriota bacterium]
MCVIQRVLLATATIAALTLAHPVAAQPPQPQQQDEFVPMSEVPPDEQLPAQPLVAAAYGFAWLAVFGYLISLSRRLGRAQAEIERLEADVHRSTRG